MSFCFSKTSKIPDRYTWMTQNMAGRKQNTKPTQKKLMKLVDLGDAASFLDRVYLGRTQQKCKPNESKLNDMNKVFEPRTSAGATEKLPAWKNFTQRRLRGPTV